MTQPVTQHRAPRCRRPFRAVAAVVCLLTVSCGGGAGNDVEAESRTTFGAPATTLAAPDTTQAAPDTTEVPPPTEAVPPPDETPTPPDDVPSIVFDLDAFDVVVSLRPTEAEPPPFGIDGFTEALALPDGSVIAAGYDARDDGATFTPDAMFRSADLTTWTRVAPSFGGPGVYRAGPLFVDEQGRPAAIAAELSGVEASDGTIDVEFGLAVEWFSEDGIGWGSSELIGNAVVIGALTTDDAVLAWGAVDPNSDGNVTAAVYRRAFGSTDWDEIVIEDQPGGVVMAMTPYDGGYVAVGATATTDPLGSIVDTAATVLAFEAQTDTGVWTSPDGLIWTAVDTDEFAGDRGFGAGLDIAAVGSDLFLLSTEVLAYQQLLSVRRSADGGRTWESITVERASQGNLFDGSEGSTFGLYAVDGYLVVLDGRAEVTGDRLLMSIIDPVTGQSVTHDVGIELGVTGIADVIQIGTTGLGFGIVDRGPDASDLQVVDIRRVDSSPDSTDTPSEPGSGA